jgi:LysM repeat protein/lysophospholipase L1-like esterase
MNMKKICLSFLFIAFAFFSNAIAQQTTPIVGNGLTTNFVDSTLQAPYIQNKISFKHSYPFVDYSKNYIEWENYTAIAHFFDKLKNSQNEKVKIFHIGDSHIQADIYPNQVRKKLHETFGTGGRGIIFPYAAARTHAGADYVTFSRGRWDFAKNVQWMPKFELGMMGITVHTKDQRASFMLRFKEESLNKSAHVLKIYCKKSPQSFDLELLTSGLEDVIHIDCNDMSDNLPYVTVQLPEEAGEILQFSVVKNEAEQHFFECNGVMIERVENNGIMYSCAGVNGASFRSLTRQSLLPEQLAELKPDLVVIDLGINDFFPLRKLQQPSFEQTIKSFIDTIRLASPKSSILLLSVQEACHRHKGLESTQEFSEMTRRIAFEKNCAFYDFYEISGSKNSMLEWQKNGLARKDFLHLTPEGYQHKGELFANAMLNAYHLHLTKKDSLQRFTLKDAQRIDSTYVELVANLQKIDTLPQEDLVISTDAGTIYGTPKAKPSKMIHTIKNGESLGLIAQKYHTTVAKLKLWNHLKSNRINKGQALIIYQGDTYTEEMEAVASKKPTKQKSVILLASHKPKKETTPNKTNVYKVKSGDSLWSIAKKYHITVEEIKNINHLTSDALSLGQMLKLK